MPGRDLTMAYRLEIYGDDRIEDETLYFHHLADAVASVEGRVSDDHDGWRFGDTSLRLVDGNHGGGAVIHKIAPVADTDALEDDVVLLEDAVYTPESRRVA